ncbi:hypothetical protein HD553DRAFT_303735 [Filobasidium floriforme]|uniref:uncharacterized protein n=1 Tax=Filobasidium floriforme TaxID=5210 RepID=UPI001E8EC269|nr:uncharacterized protein HD553DRAFT_303735 [Filobasidium floriforme]KAH8090926.1 hypothetical protein HD553DRAFT_303735 [Filobasidium floriforme]
MTDNLFRYAKAVNPDRDLPSDVKLVHNQHTMTIFDLYPKAKYHFLVLPRLPLVLPTNTSPPDKIDFFPIDLVSLSSLLRLNRHKKSPETASPPMMVLEKLKEAAEECVAMIKDEMLKTEGFIWDIWVGFHAVPSMRHVHLHIISSDLIGRGLKKKGHYNSFRPDLGFFLHLDDVLRMVREDNIETLPKPKEDYEALSRTDLECHKCGKTLKNIPLLKEHMEEEWEMLKANAKV